MLQKKKFKTPLAAAIAHLVAAGVIDNQESVAKEMSYDAGAISSYKNNKKPTPDNFIDQFEKRYKVKLDDFITLAEPDRHKKTGQRPDKVNSDAGVQNPSIDAATLETLVVFLTRLRKGEYDGVTEQEVLALFWTEHTARILGHAENIQSGKGKKYKVKSVDSSVDS